MATTVYYCASSLDGYIAAPDDKLDWLTGYEGRYEGNSAQPVEGGYEEFYEQVGALVAGSATYEWILDHLDVAGGGEWPYRGKPCWVLSSRELRLPEGEGVDVRMANASVRELYDEMAAAAGGRVLWVVGGGGVASQFADAGLLDQVQVTVVPVALGDGKPLFERRLSGDPMQLIDALPRPSGMVELRYEIRP